LQKGLFLRSRNDQLLESDQYIKSLQQNVEDLNIDDFMNSNRMSSKNNAKEFFDLLKSNTSLKELTAFSWTQDFALLIDALKANRHISILKLTDVPLRIFFRKNMNQMSRMIFLHGFGLHSQENKKKGIY
jgi:hypothetical protein